MRAAKYLNLALLATVFLACGAEDAQTKKTVAVPPQQVGTMLAKKQSAEIELEFLASLDSDQDVYVVAKVSGELKERYFEDGDTVRAGDKIFLIDPDKYEAVYESAKANVDVAAANFENAQSELNRAERLNKSNSISQKEYDSAVSAYKVALANLHLANSNLKSAELDFNYTSVKAPFDGIAAAPLKDIGEYITTSDPRLVRITKMDPIIANFAISDVESLNIARRLADKSWQAGEIKAVISYNGSEYNGTISFISPVTNSQTGTVAAKAVFANPKNEILPGTYATLKMSGIKQENVFVLPSEIIQTGVAGPYVMTYKDGKAVKKEVKISYETDQISVVEAGIDEGDEIITDNFKKVRVGADIVKAAD